MAITGKTIDRSDGRLKVTGAAKYAAEFNQNQMAYAFPARSTIAKGTITEFDTSAAEKSGGVLAVVTHKTAARLKALNPAEQLNETRFSRVDYRDVAEVAAIALTEDRLLHGTFELCSERERDRHEVAALIGVALGREIKAERINPDTLDDGAGPMRPMFDHYDHHDLVGNPLTLSAILGREPRTLRAYFGELAKTSAKSS